MVDDITTPLEKEKFRRKLLISTRILAFLLILAIFAFSYVELAKWKEFNNYRMQYGDKAYCYMCGLKEGRSCECVYLPPMSNTPETVKLFKETTALANIGQCENKNKKIEFTFPNE